MITSTYGLTATERVLPRLALDFTTAVADPRVGTARAANTATRFNQNGLIEIVNANLPRFDFSPTALTCQGQLIEETRANLFLNSLIDGTNLSTQSVTLSAVAYTLSFYGSGSVAISGGHSATVAGVGDFPNRKTYTFTPTAGSSTFTVSGDVKFAQIEAGAFATSYIPTTTTSLTRNADVVSMTGTNFSSWYNASEGTFVVWGIPARAAAYGLMTVSDGTNANYIMLDTTSGGNPRYRVAVTSASQAAIVGASVLTAGALSKVAYSYKTDLFRFAANGVSATEDTTGSVPTVDRCLFGVTTGGTYFNSHFQKLLYYPQVLTNPEHAAVSK